MRLAVALLLLVASSAQAQTGHGLTITHCVAPWASVSGASNDYADLGSTAYTNAVDVGGSCASATPTTLGTALARASAGHVIEAAPGVYLAPMTTDRNSPTWKPLVSGTSGNPITYVARYPASLNRAGSTADLSKLWFTDPSAAFEPLFGCGGHAGVATTDVVWDGWWAEATETYPQGSSGLASAGIGVDSNAPNRCTFKRNWIEVWTAYDDNNYDAFQIRAGQNVTIEDNYVEGQVQTALVSRNNSGVKCYGCQDITVRNNTFSNLVAGVFLKGKTGTMGNSGSIYLNRFTGITQAVFDIAETRSGGTMEIYQNLAYDFPGEGATCIHWDAEAGSSLLQGTTVRHNTCVFTLAGDSGSFIDIDNGMPAAAGNIHRDNLIVHTLGVAGELVNAGDAGANQLTGLGMNHDRLFNDGDTIRYAYNGTGNMTLAAFQSATGWYANVTVGDPQFESVGGDDYRLQVGSPARTASSTGGPVGAYITGSETIGAGVAVGGATVPDPPTIGTATAGNAQATVTFTAPGDDGGATITGYTATSSPDSVTGTGASSPITVTGLTNGVSYTFTVTATNSEGTSSASSASNSVTPAASGVGGRLPQRLRGGE